MRTRGEERSPLVGRELTPDELDKLRCRAEENRVFHEESTGGKMLPRDVKGALGKLGFTPDLLKNKKWDDVDLEKWDEVEFAQWTIDRHEFRSIVDDMLVEEARKHTGDTEQILLDLRVQVEEGDDSGCRASADELREQWKKVTFNKFLRWFNAMLDPEVHDDRIRLLESLMFRVPFKDDSGTWRKRVGDKRQISFGKPHGEKICHDNVVVKQRADLGFPIPAVQRDGPNAKKIDFARRGHTSWIENLLLGTVEEKYLLGYTTVKFFSPQDLPYLVRTFELAPVSSGIFATPIVNAVLTVGWHKSQKAFYGHLAMDSFAIALLSVFAFYARKRQMAPMVILLPLYIISTYDCLSNLFEFLVPAFDPARQRSWTWSDCWGSCRAQLKCFIGSLWSFWETASSLWFFGVIVIGTYSKWSIISSGNLWHPVPEAWFHDHPCWVQYLVFAKFTNVIIKFMCIRALGQRVVPAYNALTHLSSRYLLFFLLLMFLNAVISFSSVPINTYDPDDGDRLKTDGLENIFDIFVLQFNGVFLGESAPEELEAVDSRVLLHRSGNGTLQGSIKSPSLHKGYHHGVMIMNALFLVSIHIMLLNVYIGVLYEQYSNFVKKEREHFEKFRAIFTRKTTLKFCYIMRRPWLIKWLFLTTWEVREHTWIAFKKSIFAPPAAQEGAAAGDGPWSPKGASAAAMFIAAATPATGAARVLPAARAPATALPTTRASDGRRWAPGRPAPRLGRAGSMPTATPSEMV